MLLPLRMRCHRLRAGICRAWPASGMIPSLCLTASSKYFRPQLYLRYLSLVSRLLSLYSCLLSSVSCLLYIISCLYIPVSCIMYLVSCLLSQVSCLTSPVSHLLSHVSCLTSPVSCLLSHCLTSPVSHCMSLVSCLTSQLFCLLSQLLSIVQTVRNYSTKKLTTCSNILYDLIVCTSPSFSSNLSFCILNYKESFKKWQIWLINGAKMV